MMLALSAINLRAQDPPMYQVSLANNDSFAEYAFLDSVVDKYRIFMTGENHTFVTFNTRLELKMLRYLNHKVGLRNFVLELGPARAHYMNLYISTGDSAAYNKLKATTGKKYLKFYRQLKNFNEKLPDSLKIKVWGVDVERFNDLASIWVSDLLPEQDIPDNIRIPVESIKSLSNYIVSKGNSEYESSSTTPSWTFGFDPSYISVKRSIKEFIRHYDSLRKEFTSWLGADKMIELDEAVLTLREYVQWDEYENTTFQYNWREENIFRKYMKMIKSDPNGKFFGQFGRCHSALTRQEGECNWYHYNSVINRLVTRGDTSLRSKIFAVGIYYTAFNSFQYRSNIRETDTESKDAQEEVDKLSELTDDNTLTFFDVRKAQEDYPVLAKRFQMVLINNSYGSSDDEMEEDSSDIDNDYKYYGNFGNQFLQLQTGTFDIKPKGLSNLNNYLTSLNFTTLNTPLSLKYYEFGVINTDIDDGPSEMFYFAYLPRALVGFNDTFNTYASYWTLGNEMHLGTGKKNWYVSGFYGLSFSQMKLTRSYVREGLLNPSENEDLVYRNPAMNFTIGLSANLRFLKIFGIGAKVGYQADLSNQSWRQNGNRIQGTQSFSHSGTFYSLHAGFSFLLF